MRIQRSLEGDSVNFSVDPPRRGKGLGRKLVEACLHEARVRRCECVYVECRPFDKGIPFTKLLEFYKSFGFKVADVITPTCYTLRLDL